MLASRGQFVTRKAWLKHSGYVIAAGAIVGLLGILWMVNAGCWTYFVEMRLPGMVTITRREEVAGVWNACRLTRHDSGHGC